MSVLALVLPLLALRLPVVALCYAITGTVSADSGTAFVCTGIFAILESYRMSYPARIAFRAVIRVEYRTRQMRYDQGAAS